MIDTFANGNSACTQMMLFGQWSSLKPNWNSKCSMLLLGKICGLTEATQEDAKKKWAAEKRKKNESEASEPKMLDGKCFKARLQKRTNLCNWFWGQWSQRAHPTPDGATSDGSHWRSSQALSCQSKMKSLQITLLLEKNGGYFAMRLKQKTAYFRSIFTYNYLEKCQP